MHISFGIFGQMIINRRVISHFLKSSFSHIVFMAPHSFLHAYNLILLILLQLSSSQLFFSFHSIFYCLTDQCICARTFNVLNIETTKVFLFSRSRSCRIILLTEYPILNNVRIVALSLIVLFVSGIKVLPSLWNFTIVSRLFSIS